MAMFIPEAIEGAEVLGPMVERFGGKIASKALGYVAKHPKTVTALAMSANFSHHKDHLMNDTVADHVQTFHNVYTDHPTKIKVNHNPSAYYQRGRFPHELH